MNIFVSHKKAIDLVGNIIMQPILSNNARTFILDVGAAGGSAALDVPQWYTSNSKLIGFEPDPDDMEDSNDIKSSQKQNQHFFKEIEYFNSGIWDKKCKKTLRIAEDSSICSTVVGDPRKEITTQIYRNGIVQFDTVLKFKKRLNINCERLDKLIDPNTEIDYLKIDVEGAEINVLKSAEEIFKKKNILFIKSEHSMVPFLDDMTLFGHQQVFLHDNGFRLLGFNSDLFSPKTYTRYPSGIMHGVDRRQPLLNDAFFALDPDQHNLSKIQLQRLGVISIIHGFFSYGISLLRDAGYNSKKELDDCEKIFNKIMTKKRFIYSIANTTLKLRRLVK